ncbi:unnamed protein product [Malus baccata var. baccata]
MLGLSHWLNPKTVRFALEDRLSANAAKFTFQNKCPFTVWPGTLTRSGGGQDFYDVSLVDRFNVRLGVAPPGGSGGCSVTSCPRDVNNVCLNELGAYGSPTMCPPTEYSKIFKSQCPHAYSYAYDAKTSTFTCTGGPDYVITFCP